MQERSLVGSKPKVADRATVRLAQTRRKSLRFPFVHELRKIDMSTANADVFTLGHSPDPDDAFMFYAMAENKIDLRGYSFEHRLEDIQTLNERAMRGELHISAISIHAYAYVADKYALLPCGASMGNGYGPVVVRKRSTLNAERPASNGDSIDDSGAREFLNGKKIAVPGTMTSAFLALQLFLGEFEFT